MEPKSSLNHSIPSDLNGHYHCGYGGAIVTEHSTSQQHYSNTGRKKSKVRLNDQLIPKPTDINIAEKFIKIATPKEHPYSSHISRFAMFPSFRSPDDPETGVRAASQPYLSPLNAYSAPEVTLRSKTIGGPCRHEILATPIKNRKKAVMWIREHSFSDQKKPLKGENQVFYPTPPRTVLPNPKVRDWDFTLSERTSNMLKNLERTHWITSYQMHYTGSGPANPLKIDDFKEKMSTLTGMNSHTAPLRERSYPVFVPSKPKEGCRRRQGSHVGGSTCSPINAELLDPSSAPKQGTATATLNEHRPQEITAEHNEAPDLIPKGHSQSKNSTGSAEAQSAELSKELSHQQQTECKSSAYEDRDRGNGRVQFDESPLQVSVSRSSQEANTAWIADTERPRDLYNRPLSQREIDVDREKSPIELCDEPSSKKQYFQFQRNSSSHSKSAVAKDQAGIDSYTELSSRAAPAQKKLAEVRELSQGISNPCILPRPPVLPGIRPLDRAGTMGGENAANSLLDLQNSFSKSEAHHNFTSSITRAAVNPRDNVVTGKKHNFYGINCYYLHG
ncbi:uncharacterized protein C7orf31 homolog [Xiphias gladius]|uniref:uncharacterized protein C7orf31 homolog n=1 Tax=Xiphias gladius TaxID=8245 RepID=UPI001A999DC7|nr:uncharacterized protein C7orf31 homolog [Xiphias gladius]